VLRRSYAPDAARPSFTLGDWLVEPEIGRITREEQIVKLRPRAMDVLVCLANTSAGIAATKQHIIDTVWHTDFVSEQVVAQVITELRAALGDNARSPKFIETVPRRGYRLMTPARAVEADRHEATQKTPSFSLKADDHEYPLSQGSVVIGRAPDATIQIDRSEVSRWHARITIEGSTVTLEDLGSKNGTFLNTPPVVEPTRLQAGDEIWIGISVARLRLAVAGEATETEQSATT
jgi:DNA-binding winged helix-turn-helix (wHTH) protein